MRQFTISLQLTSMGSSLGDHSLAGQLSLAWHCLASSSSFLRVLFAPLLPSPYAVTAHSWAIMVFWSHSLADQCCLDALVSRWLLRGGDFLLPSLKDAPNPLARFMVSFVHFPKRGLTMPPHPFLVGLLHHYQIEMHHSYEP